MDRATRTSSFSCKLRVLPGLGVLGRYRWFVTVLPSLSRRGFRGGGSRRALVVEDAGADLEQEAGAAGCAARLLFLDYALADDLVDRGTR